MNALTASLAGPPAVWRRPVLLMAVLTLGLIVLYGGTATEMVTIWAKSETFTHAFLVPPISLWLAWRNRSRLQGLLPRPMPWVLGPMALAAFAWLLGSAVAVNAATQFALVVMIVLCVPLVAGWDVTRALLFPLLYLFFCVPFGDFLLPVLMEWTADFTVAALRLTGIPVFRQGMYFTIPSGNWSVVEACSGVRYLIASLMVGSLFAYLNFQSTKRRLLFIGVSILVPIVANWLRAYMIVMLGHLSDNRIATGVDHLLYGWVFFGIVITLMFMIGARWSEPDAPRSATPSQAAAAASPNQTLLVAGLAVIACAWPQVLLHARNQAINEPQIQIRASSELAPDWKVVSVGPGKDPVWQPRFENPSASWHGLFERQGQRVGAHLLYYRGQGPNRKLVSSQNLVVRRSVDKGWNPVAVATTSMDVPGGVVQWRRTHLLRPQSSSLGQGDMTVWQVYWAGDRLTSNDAQAKVFNAIDDLFGRGDDGAAIFLYAEGAPSDGADRLLESFAAANLNRLVAALRATRDFR